MSKEAMRLALEAVYETIIQWDEGGGKRSRRELARRIVALAEQTAQQEQGDSICQEDDGCPTELAVLQRFWRGQPIPDEHYPAWFKPAPVPSWPYDDETEEPCPSCGKALQLATGGGVVCSAKCGYWFCF